MPLRLMRVRGEIPTLPDLGRVVGLHAGAGWDHVEPITQAGASLRILSCALIAPLNAQIVSRGAERDSKIDDELIGIPDCCVSTRCAFGGEMA